MTENYESARQRLTGASRHPEETYSHGGGNVLVVSSELAVQLLGSPRSSGESGCRLEKMRTLYILHLTEMYSQYIRNKIHIDILFLQISWKEGNGPSARLAVHLLGMDWVSPRVASGRDPRINDADVQIPAMVDRSFPPHRITV